MTEGSRKALVREGKQPIGDNKLERSNMKKPSTSGLNTIIAIVLCGLVGGCMAPKKFGYKVEEQGAIRCGTQFANVSIAVMPMTDSRTDRTSTEGWSLLAFLPLVPCVPYHNYDLEHYSADTGKLEFDTVNDLRNAVIEHLKYDGIAEVSSVVCANPEVRQYTLDVNICSLGVEGYRTMYCLGIIPGCYVAILGAPFNYSKSMLGLELTLKNAEGKVVLRKAYSEDRSYCVGEYYNWNVFKQVGYNLSSIMNRACADMAQAIATDCPNVKLTQRVYMPPH